LSISICSSRSTIVRGATDTNFPRKFADAFPHHREFAYDRHPNSSSHRATIFILFCLISVPGHFSPTRKSAENFIRCLRHEPRRRLPLEVGFHFGHPPATREAFVPLKAIQHRRGASGTARDPWHRGDDPSDAVITTPRWQRSSRNCGFCHDATADADAQGTNLAAGGSRGSPAGRLREHHHGAGDSRRQ